MLVNAPVRAEKRLGGGVKFGHGRAARDRPYGMPEPALALKHLMMKQGVMQVELAERTGLSVTTICRLLNRPLLPVGSHWPAILKALDCELVIRPRKR